MTFANSRQRYMAKKKGWKPPHWGKIKQVEASREEQRRCLIFFRAKCATTPCKVCGRLSRKRIGERRVRRPLNFYTVPNLRQAQTTRLISFGRLDQLEELLKECLPLCRPCWRRARGWTR